MDIIVTTPKSQRQKARQEAADIKKAGEGYYFRFLGQYKPKNADIGDKVFYIDDGFVRGFATITNLTESDGETCMTSGEVWPAGWYAIMDATTWTWITPIAMKGFQGWRYFSAPYLPSGDWLSPTPY
jgi:hypothetical protein